MKAKERKLLKQEIYNWIWETYKGRYTMEEITKSLKIPLSTFALYIIAYRKRQQENQKVVENKINQE